MEVGCERAKGAASGPKGRAITGPSWRHLAVSVVSWAACAYVPAGVTELTGTNRTWDTRGEAAIGRQITGYYLGVDWLGMRLIVDGQLAEVVQLYSSGDIQFTTRLSDGQSFAIQSMTPTQSCDVIPAEGRIAGEDISVSVRCGVRLTFTNGQPASLVLGQPDLNSGAVLAADANTFNAPSGLWYDPFEAHLYVGDTGNNRVIGFGDESVPNASRTARYVLGQASYTAAASGSAAASMNGPTTLYSNNTLFAVADSGNNRVLLFLPFPTQGGARPAAGALGQPDLVSHGPGCGPASLNAPAGVHVTKTRVIVADTANNRVLVWSPVPSSGSAAPALVLGQPDFMSCAAATSASSLSTPAGVWSDDHSLFVVDSGNHRVLIWRVFPSTSGQAADVVIGQPDFDSQGAGVSATAMSHPTFAYSNNLQLFVADTGNQRVLIWNTSPQTSGVPADVVLGQPDFTHAGVATTAGGFAWPTAIEAHANQLAIADRNNNRVVIFDSGP